eukprot:4985217-Amphidinium_carterae.1
MELPSLVVPGLVWSHGCCRRSRENWINWNRKLLLHWLQESACVQWEHGRAVRVSLSVLLQLHGMR